MSYRVVNGKLYSIEDFARLTCEKSKKAESNAFKDILNKEINKNDSFVISKHAAERLMDRNISLNESDMNKINEGINKAVEKGSNESLILYKDLVFVASIKNRTIITAVDKDSSKGNVFTNIDSVVLI
ncbi:TIGR02530 family flagellar biosynthesis protein [Candidatus Clostridium radicumherbarum]|uniref:TIGR02530 family flagellar biosynthesis protein n=1 Tax=Candidatus Clostridium radicumherbarum TaxID=3381662 RepID=A0ABW8TVX9_9CLOT